MMEATNDFYNWISKVAETVIKQASDAEAEPVNDDYARFLIGVSRGGDLCGKIETYTSIDGWEVSYRTPLGFSIRVVQGCFCLFCDERKVCRFHDDEETIKRMIGHDVETMKIALEEEY